MVAITAGQHRKAIGLRTCDDHQRAIEISLFQAHGSFAGKTHNPVALPLEGVEGPVQVDHPGHWQVFQSACRHLGHRSGQTCTPALGQHKAMGAQGFGTAHDGPQVVGVGEAINRHEQGGLSDGGTALNQSGQVKGFGGGRLQGNALVHGSAGELAQAGPGHLFNQNTRGFGLPKQLQELGAEPHLWRAPDAVDGPAAFQHGLGAVAPPNQIGRRLIAMAFGLTRRTLGFHGHDQRPGACPISAAVRAGGNKIATVGPGPIRPAGPKTGGAKAPSWTTGGTATRTAIEGSPLRGTALRGTPLKGAAF